MIQRNLSSTQNQLAGRQGGGSIAVRFVERFAICHEELFGTLPEQYESCWSPRSRCRRRCTVRPCLGIGDLLRRPGEVGGEVEDDKRSRKSAD